MLSLSLQNQHGLLKEGGGAYLRAGQLLVLLPLSHLDGRQVSHRRHEEVHQDVLAVGGAVHQDAE